MVPVCELGPLDVVYPKLIADPFSEAEVSEPEPPSGAVWVCPLMTHETVAPALVASVPPTVPLLVVNVTV
jgi:hypothetical protein